MTIYYLDNSAANASGQQCWPPRPPRPSQTLAAINNRAFAPGDTISIHAGTTYQGTLGITADGTASAPIVFHSYGTGSQAGHPVRQHQRHPPARRQLRGGGRPRRDRRRPGRRERRRPASSHNTIQNTEVWNAGMGMEAYGQYNRKPRATMSTT